MTSKAALATPLTVLAMTAAAPAAIVSIGGGGIIHETPDPNFPIPNSVEANVVQGINEKQGLVLGKDLVIDDLQSIIGVVNLPAGSLVSSHLLTLDPTFSTPANNVQIVFDQDVLAVVASDLTLFETHATFGLEGLNYPGFVINYGFEPTEQTIAVSGNTISFTGFASTPGDYFRVITAVPAPGTALLLTTALAATPRRRR